MIGLHTKDIAKGKSQMAKRKTRKRKVNLGSTSSEHRAEANRYLSEAQSQIQHLERASGSCLSTMHGIVGAERSMAKATTHVAAMGGPIKYKTRFSKHERNWGSALKQLRERLNNASESFENSCMRG